MLISVLSNQRDDFDKLFAFYQDHTTTQGLMVWQQLLDSNDQIYDVTDKNSTNAIYTPATDGDLDAAYALLLAGATFKNREIMLCSVPDDLKYRKAAHACMQ